MTHFFRFDRANAYLDEAQRTAAETESIGTGWKIIVILSCLLSLPHIHSLTSSNHYFVCEGQSIVENLYGQREQLLNTSEKVIIFLQARAIPRSSIFPLSVQVSETNSMTKEAGAVLRSMGRRAIYNKLFLWLTIFFLILCNILVLYYLYIKPAQD